MSTTTGKRTPDRIVRITRIGPNGILSSNRSPPSQSFGYQALHTLQRQAAYPRISVCIGKEQLGFQILITRVGPAPLPVGLQRVELPRQRRQIGPRPLRRGDRVEPGENVVLQLEPESSPVAGGRENAMESTGIKPSHSFKLLFG